MFASRFSAGQGLRQWPILGRLLYVVGIEIAILRVVRWWAAPSVRRFCFSITTTGKNGMLKHNLRIFAPNLGKLDNHFNGLDHFVEAGPFEWRVRIVLSGREIWRRQTEFCQLRTVCAASDDC
jgi:hypothetical protein